MTLAKCMEWLKMQRKYSIFVYLCVLQVRFGARMPMPGAATTTALRRRSVVGVGGLVAGRRCDTYGDRCGDRLFVLV